MQTVILTSDTKVKTLEEAVDVLHAIGCEENAAHIMHTNIGGGAYCMLLYEACIGDKRSMDRTDIPSTLEKQLYSLFDPFLYKEDYRVRSLIRLRSPQSPSPRWHLTMLLHIKQEFVEEATRALTKYSDSTSKTEGTAFCLD